MTMIELGIVMGIVSVLLALVLGLARHVDAAVKIRRAQTDLAEWHESLNRWFLQFGEYPHAQINTANGTAVAVYGDPLSFTLSQPSTYPLARLTNETSGAFVRYDTPATNITFRSFLTAAASTVDPWGTPYIYLPSANARAYDLFSCGPNRQTLIGSRRIPSTAAATTLDPTLDDIHLEK
jgi:type II secretory pathway pseudopilin PulG